MWYPYRLKTKLDSYFTSFTTAISKWTEDLSVKDTPEKYLEKNTGGFVVSGNDFFFCFFALNTYNIKFTILTTYSVQFRDIHVIMPSLLLLVYRSRITNY